MVMIDDSGRQDDLTIYGTSGNDTIIGGSGYNYIDGNGGDDILTGGGGHNTFVVYTSGGSVTITNFTIGKDSLLLSTPIYAGSAAGSIGNTGAFTNNVGATINSTNFTTHPLTIGSIQASEYPDLSYDLGTGALSYNNNKIALLPAGLNWNPTDPNIVTTANRA